MATPIRPFEQYGIYHVFNRGNHKQPIFLSTDDYVYFLEKLSGNCRKNNVEILAYCLMRNHYHLILRQNSDTGITPAMLATGVSLVKRFNSKYKTVGRLFQERFKAIRVHSNDQLLHVSRYIHLNPAEFGDYEDYRWSSYREYVHPDKAQICHPTPVLETIKDYGVTYPQFVAQFATPGVAEFRL